MKEITAENLTDEQIREYGMRDVHAFFVARDATQYHETLEPYASIRRDAREHIATAINAREAGGK